MARLPLEGALAHLGTVAPVATARARRALERVLEGARRSPWPDVAWRFSHLTGSGFPLELVFRPSDVGVRYTAEVTGPEVAPADRVDAALRCLLDLGVPLPRLEQPKGSLRWGAWLSGRHTASSDAYKLYVEARDDPPFQLPDRAAPACLVGHASESIERYYRASALADWELEHLCGRLGLQAQAAALLALVRSVARRAPLHGFSIAEPVPVLTVYSFARALGDDVAIRARLLATGADLGAYAAVSAKARGTGRLTAHGLLGFTVTSDTEPAFSVGLCPDV